MKRALIGLLIVLAIGAGAGAYYIRRGGTEIQVNTAPVTRGDIVDTVGASGTLQAVLNYRKALVEFKRLQQTTLQNLNVTLIGAGGGGGATTTTTTATPAVRAGGQ